MNYLNTANIYSFFDILKIEDTYKKAILYYEKAKNFAPHNPSIHVYQASLEFSNSDDDKALKSINKALEIKNNYEYAKVLEKSIKDKNGSRQDFVKTENAL